MYRISRPLYKKIEKVNIEMVPDLIENQKENSISYSWKNWYCSKISLEKYHFKN